MFIVEDHARKSWYVLVLLRCSTGMRQMPGGISVKFSQRRVAPGTCRCVNVGASLARQRRGVG